jgi:pyrroloquinoline quinone biosynthesis protein D
MSVSDQIKETDVIELIPTYLLRWEESEESYVLLYPEGIVKLNSSAGEILKRCVDGRTVAQVIADLSELCGGEDISADILAFLEIANDKGWTRKAAQA